MEPPAVKNVHQDQTTCPTPAIDPAGDAGPTVLVIGAGVSGCACAATLASAGLGVTLINSAMDRVGLPAYGPDLCGADGRWCQLEEALAELPSPLRAIWLEAGLRPVNGAAVLNIDRRRVSVETKRLLEHVPGLQFRQGFVSHLRVIEPVVDGGRVRIQAETIFGEVFEADAAVVAVGLSLAGRSLVGGDTVEGGRYGEPASNDLLKVMEALGAQCREGVLHVGPRLAVGDFRALQEPAPESRLATGTGTPGAPGGAGLGPSVVELAVMVEGDEKQSWPADFPPAPHLDPALRFEQMVVDVRIALNGEGPRRIESVPVVSPDGAATGEVYVAPGTAAARALENGEGAAASSVLTRMPLTVTAAVVRNVSLSGRLDTLQTCGRIWVVGRSAGAEDYVESLASGVRGGRDVVAELGGILSGRRAVERTQVNE